MRKTPIVALLLVLACAPPDEAAVAARQAATAMPPAGAGITVAEYVGTGCPEKSVVNSISEDKQALTSIFSAFVAQVGPAAPPEEAALHCLLLFEVEVPAGWSYSLKTLLHRGFVGLEGEVTAAQRSLALISGIPVHAPAPSTFKGTTDKDYVHAGLSPNVPASWSPCGGGQVLWVAARASVNNAARPSRKGQLTVDSIDLELQWQKCP